MQGELVILKGNKYTRDAEHIAGEGENRIEKITYFMVIDTKDDVKYGHDLYMEIYDQDMIHDLEMEYEKLCTAEFTPQLFFI
jgi:hypothetical protein